MFSDAFSLCINLKFLCILGGFCTTWIGGAGGILKLTLIEEKLKQSVSPFQPSSTPFLEHSFPSRSVYSLKFFACCTFLLFAFHSPDSKHLRYHCRLYLRARSERRVCTYRCSTSPFWALLLLLPFCSLSNQVSRKICRICVLYLFYLSAGTEIFQHAYYGFIVSWNWGILLKLKIVSSVAAVPMLSQ